MKMSKVCMSNKQISNGHFKQRFKQYKSICDFAYMALVWRENHPMVWNKRKYELEGELMV
jgi:hypothetical protein